MSLIIVFSEVDNTSELNNFKTSGIFLVRSGKYGWTDSNWPIGVSGIVYIFRMSVLIISLTKISVWFFGSSIPFTLSHSFAYILSESILFTNNS